MSNRQFSMQTYWERKAAKNIPKLRFGQAYGKFETWHEQALKGLLELMGEFPDRVPLCALFCGRGRFYTGEGCV